MERLSVIALDACEAALHNRGVPLTLASPSKINLHLRVGLPDASGFHPLRSWMITTSLRDELQFEISDQRRLTCNDAAIPTDSTNLVWRAADALLRGETEGREVAIHLTKRVPAGAGLGGGSGNAATALVGISRLLGLKRSRAELAAVALTLGSDVPFFLGPPSAIATGRGEWLEPTPPPQAARFAVLILPHFPIATAAAYRTLDIIRPAADDDPLQPFDAASWSALPAAELHLRLKNDLEPAAFTIEPRLKRLRDFLAREVLDRILMSGSGSTLFSLCDSLSEASRAADRVEQFTRSGEFGAVRTVCVELGNPSGFFD